MSSVILKLTSESICLTLYYSIIQELNLHLLSTEMKSDSLHVKKNAIFIPSDFENTNASYMYFVQIVVIMQILQIKVLRLG